MCSLSRESAEGGRVIVEVDGKVAKIRNIKVCFFVVFTFSHKDPYILMLFCVCLVIESF